MGLWPVTALMLRSSIIINMTYAHWGWLRETGWPGISHSPRNKVELDNV